MKNNKLINPALLNLDLCTHFSDDEILNIESKSYILPDSFAADFEVDDSELWKFVPGSKLVYIISNKARLASCSNNHKFRLNVFKIMKVTTDRNGYFVARMSSGGFKGVTYISRLMLSLFNPREGMENLQCAHINGRKTDNSLENLQWATAKENSSHKKHHGTLVEGSNCKQAKLSVNAVIAIRKLLKEGWTEKRIADLFEVTNNSIHQIKKGVTWKSVLKRKKPRFLGLGL